MGRTIELTSHQINRVRTRFLSSHIIFRFMSGNLSVWGRNMRVRETQKCRHNWLHRNPWGFSTLPSTKLVQSVEINYEKCVSLQFRQNGERANWELWLEWTAYDYAPFSSPNPSYYPFLSTVYTLFHPSEFVSSRRGKEECVMGGKEWKREEEGGSVENENEEPKNRAHPSIEFDKTTSIPDAGCPPLSLSLSWP